MGGPPPTTPLVKTPPRNPQVAAGSTPTATPKRRTHTADPVSSATNAPETRFKPPENPNQKRGAREPQA